MFKRAFTKNSLLGLVLAGLCLVAMAANMRLLERHSHGAAEVAPIGPDADLPPTLALTTFALGPLRGLIVDGLWWRMIRHQDAGNFFETMQLTRWITRLQPRFASVWAYQAWNLSYNVAHEFGDPEVRWQWIRRSIELLRDQGLLYNPGNAKIRFELGSIFLDRIGSHGDDTYDLYAWKWAEIMMRYLPEGSREELEALAQAPQNPEALLKDPQIASMVATAKALELDLLDPATVLRHGAWPTAQQQALLGEDTAAAWRKILLSARARALRSEMKLDLARMLHVDREFGPFDWRLSQAHAVYWMVEDGQTFQDFLGADSQSNYLIRQSMERSFFRGKLIYNAASGIYMTTNNLAIAGKIHDYYDYNLTHNYTPIMDQLHKKFLEDAIAILYSYSYQQPAMRLFRHYQQDYIEPGQDTSFENFVRRQIPRLLQGQTKLDAESMVNAALYQAYVWIVTGDRLRAKGYADMARMLWSNHQQQYAKRPARLLPPLEELMAGARQQVLAGLDPARRAQAMQTIQAKDVTAEVDDLQRDLNVGSLFSEHEGHH